MEHREYGLGRVPFMHPKAANYPIAPLLAKPVRMRETPWPKTKFSIDQGNSGTCTAASLLNIIGGTPIEWLPPTLCSKLKVDEPAEADQIIELIMALYRDEVIHDWWSDNDREADKTLCPTLEDLQWGSSVDAAMMTGVRLNFWKEVRWCKNAAELNQWVRRWDGSPGQIGINWYEEWFNLPADGVIRSARGGVAGGHALKVRWHYPRKKLWLIDNSWGKDWALNGSFYMTDDVFNEVVFRQGGECAVAVEFVL